MTRSFLIVCSIICIIGAIGIAAEQMQFNDPIIPNLPPHGDGSQVAPYGTPCADPEQDYSGSPAQAQREAQLMISELNAMSTRLSQIGIRLEQLLQGQIE